MNTIPLWVGLLTPLIAGDRVQKLTVISIVLSVIGGAIYNWALKWFSTGFVAVALLGEPIGGTILAYIIFNEKLTWLKLFGGLFLLSAIFIAAVGEKK